MMLRMKSTENGTDVHLQTSAAVHNIRVCTVYIMTNYFFLLPIVE